MFDANRRGFFDDCRQLILIDGCCLKGLYKGILLTVVSIAVIMASTHLPCVL